MVSYIALSSHAKTFSERLVALCNVLFYGLGIYGCVFQIAYSLSLIRYHYEAQVAMQVAIIMQCAATGCYVVLMYWITIKCGIWVYTVCVPDRSATTKPTDDQTLTTVDTWITRAIRCLPPLYFIVIIVNDAIINRLVDSPVVEGALDRMLDMLCSSFEMFLVELSYLSFVFIFGLLYVLWRVYAAARRAREEEIIDIESNANAELEALDRRTRLDVWKEKEVLFEVDEAEMFKFIYNS